MSRFDKDRRRILTFERRIEYLEGRLRAGNLTRAGRDRILAELHALQWATELMRKDIASRQASRVLAEAREIEQ